MSKRRNLSRQKQKESSEMCRNIKFKKITFKEVHNKDKKTEKGRSRRESQVFLII